MLVPRRVWFSHCVYYFVPSHVGKLCLFTNLNVLILPTLHHQLHQVSNDFASFTQIASHIIRPWTTAFKLQWLQVSYFLYTTIAQPQPKFPATLPLAKLDHPLSSSHILGPSKVTTVSISAATRAEKGTGQRFLPWPPQTKTRQATLEKKSQEIGKQPLVNEKIWWISRGAFEKCGTLGLTLAP